MLSVDEKIKQAIISGGTDGYQEPYVQIDLTPKSSTKKYLNIEAKNIKQGGLVIDKSCLSGDALELGSTVAAEMTLTLLNHDGKYNKVDFNGTWAAAYVIVKVDGLSTSKCTIRLGSFVIDEVTKSGDEITLKGLDYMMWLDHAVKDTLKLKRGTMATRLRSWTNDGVMAYLPWSDKLKSKCPKFPNGKSWKLAYDPKNSFQNPDGNTVRQLLSQFGVMFGVNWYITPYGNLHYKMYPQFDSDTKQTAAPKTTITPSMRFSSDIEPQEVKVTDMKYTWKDKEYTLIGDSSGTVIDLGEHYLSPKDTKLDVIKARFENMRTGRKMLMKNKEGKAFPFAYYKTSMSCLPMFWFEPMDWVYYEDNEGNKYPTLITSCTYTINSTMELESGGENEQQSGYSQKWSPASKRYSINNEKSEEAAQKAIASMISASGLHSGLVGEDQLIWTDNQRTTPEDTDDADATNTDTSTTSDEALEAISLTDEASSVDNNSAIMLADTDDTDTTEIADKIADDTTTEEIESAEELEDDGEDEDEDEGADDEPTEDDDSYDEPAEGSTVWRLDEDGTILSTDNWQGSTADTDWKSGVENANDLYVKNLFAKNILASGEIRYESDDATTVTILNKNGISAKTGVDTTTGSATTMVAISSGGATFSLDGGKHSTYIMGSHIECESLRSGTYYDVASYIGLNTADASATTVKTDTWTRIATISLKPGYYTGAVYGGFAQTSSGTTLRLAFSTATSITQSTLDKSRALYVTANGTTGDRVGLPVSFQVGSTTTYYIYARHNASTSVAVTPTYGFLRIAGG